MARKYGDVEWNQMDAVKNRAKCFEELLDADRGDWDKEKGIGIKTKL